MRLAVFLFAWGIAQAGSLWFEPNQGQVHPSVRFLAHTPTGYVYLGRDRLTLRDIRLDLIGANKEAVAQLEQPTGGISSYFIGRTEKDWHTGIPHYGRVRYKSIYAGIDLVYYGNGRNIEYDFALKPGADPNQIKLAYNKPLRLDTNGDLLIGGLRQKRPKVYQDGREISCDYLVAEDNRVQLALAQYDPSQALTVDPVLEFSTYLGGLGEDLIRDVKVDAAGFIYVAGHTQSAQSPSLSPFQQPSTVNAQPFVMKLSSDGLRVLLFAVLGSNGWDLAFGLGVDHDGSIVLSGSTRSTNFPLKNAFQTEFKAVWDNAFISRLTPDGKSLAFSTYYGGSTWEFPIGGLALDSQGNVWVTGYTESRDLPVRNAAQSTLGGSLDCFLAKFSPAGAFMVGTYWGGSDLDSCHAVAVDGQDNVYIGGSAASDDFPLRNAIQSKRTPRGGWVSPALTKFTPSGQAVFSTFLANGSAGGVSGIAFDMSGNIYLTGALQDSHLITTATAFQVTPGDAFDAFVIKLDPVGSKILYSTYLGGTGSDTGQDIKVDSNGYIYVYGYTSSADFPVKGSLQQFKGGGVLMDDTFIAKFTPSGNTLVYSTLLGGSGNENASRIALDSAANVYAVGTTNSPDFPLAKAYQPTAGGGFDGFLAKISDNTALLPSSLTPSPARLVFRYVQASVIPGAQTVTVAGGAFTASSPVTWLITSVNGLAASVSVNPAGLATGTYTTTLVLLPQAGAPATVDVALTVLAPAPLLSSAEPSFIPINSNTTTVTLRGSGFSRDAIVMLFSVPYTPVQFIDSGTLRFTLPANNLTGSNNLIFYVKNPDSELSDPVSVAIGIPAPQITAVTNAASFATGPVAPGEIVTIFGTNLTDAVTFDNIPATLVYSSATQVSVTVPYAVTGTTTMMQVGSSAPVKLDVAHSAPGIFAAVRAGGNVLVLYATGCGQLTTEDLPRCALPVSAMVNGQPATVLYAGIAPGLVQGANQVNIQLPDGITSGALSIVLTAGDASSKSFAVTLP